MTQTGLRLENLRILRRSQQLVALDTHVAPGAVLTVMGASGVGKSTLLAAITGTLPTGFRAEGRIILNGEDISRKAPEHRHVGILFQEELLFPHLSVGGNLAFGLPPRIRGRAARRAKIEEALDDVGLAGFAARDPATLSGGQKARVALMRMLLSEPKALLLDEAFAGLDAALRAQVRQLVFDRARARALPVLMVTHDAADAQAAGGRLIVLEPR
ncbi:MAG: ABC transporter ATP-binding protein [Confluentimicrobium sp.]|uniref:ATP-binding cassette domain-containing protein n=1 Tax=Actibacterium sp. TaxID=1872125 RepID=UPI000C353B89|nr:ATP-binding cassette domain-containing protein [Actibacterium sp.]MBC56025.1 ABC transporter ATP-binding protein [Actibacterium sp.]